MPMTYNSAKLQQNVATNLKYLRDKWDLTITSISEDVGVTVSAISHIEHGRKLPSLEITQRLCKLFHVTFEELTANDYPPVRRPKKGDRISEEAIDLSRTTDAEYYPQLKPDNQ